MKYIKYTFASLIFALLGLVTQSFFGATVNAASSPVGTMVVTTDGSVYMALEKIKRPYTSAAAFLSYSFNSWDKVSQATTEDISLTSGDFIPPREGSIICSDRDSDKGTCYLITDSKKAAFTSAEVFKQLGFTFEQALTGDVSFVVTTDSVSSGTEGHRPGTLVKKDNNYYLIGKNGLIGMPTELILNSWGYKLSDAKVPNAKDLELPYRFDAQVRQSNELRPYEPTIPQSLNLDNKEKFSIPFKRSDTPLITEAWIYSSEERSIHGFTNHGGVDFAQPYGTAVYAAADGYAISSTQLAPQARTYEGKTIGFGLGEFVQVWHPMQGVFTSYSHLSKVEKSIPYFKPTCKDGACDPEVVYNDSSFSVKKGKHVKRGELIGYVGDSGLSWGYDEEPRGAKRNLVKEPSWDESHLHFEMYTRVAPNYTKARRYDPFGIYGRLSQYDAASYVGPDSIWKIGTDNKVEFAK